MEGRSFLKVNRRHCPHCTEQLSIKTFKAHKRRYYDSQTGVWLKKSQSIDSDIGEDTPSREESPSLAFLDDQSMSADEDNHTRRDSVSPPCFLELNSPTSFKIQAGELLNADYHTLCSQLHLQPLTIRRRVQKLKVARVQKLKVASYDFTIFPVSHRTFSPHILTLPLVFLTPCHFLSHMFPPLLRNHPFSLMSSHFGTHYQII